MDDSYGGTIPIGDPNNGPIPPGYTIDPNTGQLVPLPSSPFTPTPGTNPTGPATAPPGTPLFTPTPGSNPNQVVLGPNAAPFVSGQPTPTQYLTPPAAGGSTTTTPGGIPGTLSGLLAPFTGTFTAPTPTAYPTAPTLNLPTYTPPPAFAAPTADEALNDPGYQFAAQQGEQALDQSAAAGGLLNTGGTLKDILAWGQNYAAQRYGDVYNRDLSTYNTNLNSQYVQPYQFAYQGALATGNQTQSQWQTNMAAIQRQNENDYANAYQRFLQSYAQFQDQRDSTFNKTYQYETA